MAANYNIKNIFVNIKIIHRMFKVVYGFIKLTIVNVIFKVVKGVYELCRRRSKSQNKLISNH